MRRDLLIGGGKPLWSDMRPQHEVLLAVGLLVGVFGGTAYLASLRTKSADRVGYVTTFSTEPPGAQGFFTALQQLGVGTRRFRKRTATLPSLVDSSRRQLVAVLGPEDFSPAEMTVLLDLSQSTDMLVAGPSASQFFECFGYFVNSPRGDTSRVLGISPLFTDLLRRDSVQAAPPGVAVTERTPWVFAVLGRSYDKTVVDSSRRADAGIFRCTVPKIGRVDTLLITKKRQVVALRLQREDGGAWLTLVADHGLFRNAQLRRTDAGEFALGLVAGRYDEVIFEEYHHGFGEQGSLRSAVVAWSRSSPWGWSAWQLVAVGILGLLFGMVRFGPLQPAIVRTRRSSLEHVQALATALGAAHGHDEAIGAIVRGLRRRLTPGGRQSGGDWRTWLTALGEGAHGANERRLIAELKTLTTAGQPAQSVLRAANTVEELWQELRP